MMITMRVRHDMYLIRSCLTGAYCVGKRSGVRMSENGRSEGRVESRVEWRGDFWGGVGRMSPATL